MISSTNNPTGRMHNHITAGPNSVQRNERSRSRRDQKTGVTLIRQHSIKFDKKYIERDLGNKGRSSKVAIQSKTVVSQAKNSQESQHTQSKQDNASSSYAKNEKPNGVCRQQESTMIDHSMSYGQKDRSDSNERNDQFQGIVNKKA